MITMHLLLALIPSLLIVLFINRISSNPKSKIISIRNLFYLIASWAIILIVISNRIEIKGSPEPEVKQTSRNLNSTINPDILSELPNADINFISGVFYEKAFKRIEMLDGENKVEYRFTLLYSPENNQNLQSVGNWFDFERKNQIREYAYVKLLQPNVIYYILKRSSDYHKFQSYLIEIGNLDKSTIDQSSISARSNIITISYHNSTFVFKGFQVSDNGYRIEIRKASSERT